MINMYKIIYLLIFLLSKGWETFLYYLNLKHSLKEDKVPDIFIPIEKNNIIYIIELKKPKSN